jgi:hypothetical protein
MTLQKHGFQPRVVSWGGPDNILLYTPWLLALPVLGAFGAYLSQRAGASGGKVLLASIFPVLTLAAFLFLVLPVSSIVDSQVSHKIRIAGFLRAFVEWLAIPGIALLAGGLPTLLFLSRRPTPRETPTN